MSESTSVETTIPPTKLQPSQPTHAQVQQIIMVLLVITAGLAVFIAARFVGVAPLPSQKWEYKITSPDDLSFDTEVNKLGQEGWELVVARRATSRYGNEASYEMIFKRPVSATSGTERQ